MLIKITYTYRTRKIFRKFVNKVRLNFNEYLKRMEQARENQAKRKLK